MYIRGLFAAFTAVALCASLVETAEAYPTTARSGTSTVTGVYRPLVLDLDVVETVPLSILNCDGACNSSVDFEDDFYGAYVSLSLFLTGSYTTFGDSVPVGGPISGSAGYWEYSFFARDGDSGLTVDSSISPTEFSILIGADAVGVHSGTLTYLGGGSFTGVPASDTPLLASGTRGDDWFQYFTTMAATVMRIRSSDSSGSDFVLTFEQPIKHLGPFGSSLDVARTNPGCLVNGVDDEDGTRPCGNVTLLARAAANSITIPEPGSLALLGLGLAALALGRRKSRLPAAV